MNGLLKYVESNYRYLEQFIASRLRGIDLVAAEALYLVWLDCHKLGLDDYELKSLFLDKAKVVLEWGPNFGEEGSGFVRLNIACPRSTLQRGLERIETAISNI